MTTPNRIRLRLTAWYAVSIAIVLLAATLVMRTVMHEEAERAFMRAQSASVGLVRGFFRTEVYEYGGVDATLNHLSGELVFPDRRISFIAPDGRPYQPPKVGRRVLPETPLEPPIRETTEYVDPALAPDWRVRVEQSAAELERQEHRIDSAVMLAVPLIAAVAWMLGWVITGRTLAPMRRMALTAEAIEPQSGARLPVEDPLDEFGRLGTRFNALLDRLDGALAQQRRFLGDAAHELRSPLARIRGNVDVALSRPADAPADRASLQSTSDDLARISHLVDQLMQLARADASMQEAHLARHYLDDVVAGAIGPWTRSAREREVQLELRLDEEAPALLDPALVERLAGVLVDNALRYTPAGGTVTIIVRQTPAGARLEVADSGIGIPEAERGRVFDRFFRGVRARERDSSGSGLGLAIARWVAEQHGATIGVELPTAGGTMVWVQFPPLK